MVAGERSTPGCDQQLPAYAYQYRWFWIEIKRLSTPDLLLMI